MLLLTRTDFRVDKLEIDSLYTALITCSLVCNVDYCTHSWHMEGTAFNLNRQTADKTFKVSEWCPFARAGHGRSDL